MHQNFFCALPSHISSRVITSRRFVMHPHISSRHTRYSICQSLRLVCSVSVIGARVETGCARALAEPHQLQIILQSIPAKTRCSPHCQSAVTRLVVFFLPSLVIYCCLVSGPVPFTSSCSVLTLVHFPELWRSFCPSWTHLGNSVPFKTCNKLLFIVLLQSPRLPVFALEFLQAQRPNGHALHVQF